MSLLRQGTREANDAAHALFEQALALDPYYARGHSGLLLCWFNQWNGNFWDRFEEASWKPMYMPATRWNSMTATPYPSCRFPSGALSRFLGTGGLVS